MSTASCRQLSPVHHPNLSLVQTLEQSASLTAPKFDAAFLERRMQQHHEQMAAETALLATEIILEVSIALDTLEDL